MLKCYCDGASGNPPRRGDFFQAALAALLALIPLGRFLIPLVHAQVGTGTRMRDHVRVDFDADALQEVDEADALDHLAATLMLQAVLRPEVDDGVGELLDPLIVFVGFELLDRYDHGAHGVADLEGALAADEDGDTLVVARRERLGHDVEAVHGTT